MPAARDVPAAPASAKKGSAAARQQPASQASADISPSARVRELEKQVEVLQRLGVAQATVDAVKAEVEEARRQQVCAKPIGARMDSAAARLERARKRLHAANEGVDDALRRQEDALAEEAEATRELTELASEAARADCKPAIALGSAVDAALKTSRALLETLERHCLGSSAPPEPIVATMQILATALKEVDEYEPEVKFGVGPATDLEEDNSGSEAGDDKVDDPEADEGDCAMEVGAGGELPAPVPPPVGPSPVSPAQARAALRAMGGVDPEDPEAAKRKLEELVAVAAAGVEARTASPLMQRPAKSKKVAARQAPSHQA